MVRTVGSDYGTRIRRLYVGEGESEDRVYVRCKCCNNLYMHKKPTNVDAGNYVCFFCVREEERAKNMKRLERDATIGEWMAKTGGFMCYAYIVASILYAGYLLIFG